MAVSHPNPHLARLEIALPAQFMLISNSPGPDFQHLNLRCSVHGTAWQKKTSKLSEPKPQKVPLEKARIFHR